MKLIPIMAALLLTGCASSHLDIQAASMRVSEYNARYSGVPTGWEVDEFGACYPSDIKFTPSADNPNHGIASSDTAGMSKEITIRHLEHPGDAHPSKSRNVCAFSMVSLNQVVLPPDNQHLKHELGHLLGVTWHNCVKVSFHPCQE